MLARNFCAVCVCQLAREASNVDTYGSNSWMTLSNLSTANNRVENATERDTCTTEVTRLDGFDREKLSTYTEWHT